MAKSFLDMKIKDEKASDERRVSAAYTKYLNSCVLRKLSDMELDLVNEEIEGARLKEVANGTAKDKVNSIQLNMNQRLIDNYNKVKKESIQIEKLKPSMPIFKLKDDKFDKLQSSLKELDQLRIVNSAKNGNVNVAPLFSSLKNLSQTICDSKSATSSVVQINSSLDIEKRLSEAQEMLESTNQEIAILKSMKLSKTSKSRNRPTFALVNRMFHDDNKEEVEEKSLLDDFYD